MLLKNCLTLLAKEKYPQVISIVLLFLFSFTVSKQAVLNRIFVRKRILGSVPQNLISTDTTERGKTSYVPCMRSVDNSCIVQGIYELAPNFFARSHVQLLHLFYKFNASAIKLSW
jgi:hypothetical protein